MLSFSSHLRLPNNLYSIDLPGKIWKVFLASSFQRLQFAHINHSGCTGELVETMKFFIVWLPRLNIWMWKLVLRSNSFAVLPPPKSHYHFSRSCITTYNIIIDKWKQAYNLCLVRLQRQISRETFESGLEFEPRTCIYLAWRSTIWIISVQLTRHV